MKSPSSHMDKIFEWSSQRLIRDRSCHRENGPLFRCQLRPLPLLQHGHFPCFLKSGIERALPNSSFERSSAFSESLVLEKRGKHWEALIAIPTKDRHHAAREPITFSSRQNFVRRYSICLIPIQK